MTAPAGATRALVVGPLGDVYRDDATLDALSTRFAADGYVRLPGLLTDEAMDLLRAEIAALEPAAQSRDFVMPGPGTPRVMSVLGATQLLDGATAPAIMYAHFELVRSDRPDRGDGGARLSPSRGAHGLQLPADRAAPRTAGTSTIRRTRS